MDLDFLPCLLASSPYQPPTSISFRDCAFGGLPPFWLFSVTVSFSDPSNVRIHSRSTHSSPLRFLCRFSQVLLHPPDFNLQLPRTDPQIHLDSSNLFPKFQFNVSTDNWAPGCPACCLLKLKLVLRLVLPTIYSWNLAAFFLFPIQSVTKYD